VRHRLQGRKLHRPSDRRRALIRNQMAALLKYEKIQTTEARAKELRRHIERLITTAKANTLHARRLALAMLPDPQAVAKLFHLLVPRYQNRPGGYTRILKIGQRRGDAAEIVQISLVE
jgi:large subunit ribosomal protein L17